MSAPLNNNQVFSSRNGSSLPPFPVPSPRRQLPNEILMEIGSYLPSKDLAALSQVSKNFNRLGVELLQTQLDPVVIDPACPEIMTICLKALKGELSKVPVRGYADEETRYHYHSPLPLYKLGNFLNAVDPVSGQQVPIRIKRKGNGKYLLTLKLRVKNAQGPWAGLDVSDRVEHSLKFSYVPALNQLKLEAANPQMEWNQVSDQPGISAESSQTRSHRRIPLQARVSLVDGSNTLLSLIEGSHEHLELDFQSPDGGLLSLLDRACQTVFRRFRR